MRTIKIQDPEIVKLLEDKEKKSKELLKIVKKVEKLQNDYKKLITKTKRADEKVRPLIEERYKDNTELGEYEELSRVHKADKGGWQIEIADRLEEFKKAFKNQKEQIKDEKKDEESGHNNSTSQ